MTNYKTKISEKELIEFKKRRYARQALHRALRKGEIDKASRCGICLIEEELQAHHIDYGKPLDVIWLCTECHGIAHRKESELNPENNLQSPMPFIPEKYQTVTISFTIPLRNFLRINKESELTKKSISSIVRKEIMKKYPEINNQLELFGELNNDKSQSLRNSRIYNLDQNQEFLRKSQSEKLPKIRRQGNTINRELETQLFAFS